MEIDIMRPIVSTQDRFRYPLNETLGTEAQVRLLRVLALELDGPITASDAADRAMLTVRGSQKALKRLVQSGFVQLVGSGKKRQFELHRANSLVQAMQELFIEETKRYENLISAIRTSIESLASPPISAWMLRASADAEDSINLGIQHETRYLSASVQQLRKELSVSEQEFDITIEVSGYTKADVPEPDINRIIHLFGVPIFEDISFQTAGRSVRSHHEIDTQLMKLSIALLPLLQKDSSIIRRAREHVNRLLEREQGPATSDIKEWQCILETWSGRRLSRFLVSSSERANRLRQSCPLFPVLTVVERKRLLEQIEKEHDT